MAAVISAVDDGVGVVTLNRPAERNAINLELAEGIDAAFNELEADPAVAGIVVTGAGPGFCAGADLDLIGRGDMVINRQLYDAFLRVAASSLPTVAAINGVATGAGLNLLLCCDIRVTVPAARIIARFLDLGLHPGGGSTWMLSRAIGEQRAKAMMLCQQELDGYTAVTSGLALKCVESDELLLTAAALVRRAGSVPRPVVERAKTTMNAMREIGSLSAAVEVEAVAQQWSAESPFFSHRVAQLQARISQRRSQQA